MAEVWKKTCYRMLIGLLLLSLVIVPVTAVRLSTPILISPTNGQHFYHVSGTITLAWRNVTGASGYVLEVQQNNGSGWYGLYATSTSYPDIYNTTDYPTGQDYRWRVSAIDGTGVKDPSLFSAWRTFDLKLCTFKLATPTLLSPANGVTFYHGHPRMTTLAWQPVLGATYYRVLIERYQAPTGWTEHRNTTIGNADNPAYLFEANLSAQYRWRITAICGPGWFKDSSPSTTRTFTYTV